MTRKCQSDFGAARMSEDQSRAPCLCMLGVGAIGMYVLASEWSHCLVSAVGWTPCRYYFGLSS